MIDEKSIFDEVRNNISMMCGDECVGADLASAMGNAISSKVRSVCVAPNRVVDIWPWLEKTKIKIISRFYVDSAITDDFMSDLSAKISTAFRNGSHGAIIFMPRMYLPKFTAEMTSIRDDLFFNKSFSIAIDINEVGVFDWAELFGLLRILRADSLTLVFDKDTGDKSDFIGRVFAMLNAPRGEWGGAVNFMLGQNMVRVDQVYRLIRSLAPETISKTEFFIDNE